MSLIVPIQNNAEVLDRFMDSLASQSTAEPIEVLLIDDKSTDDSVGIAQQLCAKYASLFESVIVKLGVPNESRDSPSSRRKALARQIGIALSRSNDLLFLSPAYLLAPGSVAEHLWWRHQGFDIVLGAFLPFAQNDINGIIARQRSWRRHMSPVQSSETWWRYFSFANASVSRRLFDATGGLDITLQSSRLHEIDFAYRLGKTGARFWHTIRACVTRAAAETPVGETTPEAKEKESWLSMEILFRRYLDDSILEAHKFLWDNSPSPEPPSIIM